MTGSQTLTVVLVLALVVIVVNADRFYRGAAGRLRAHDGADVLVNIFESCGRFWQAPDVNLWNPSILGGWPILYGSVAPQHLGCLLGSVLPAPYIVPVLIVALECLILAGTFLFLQGFRGYPEKVSVYGALFNLAIYYWYHENTVITIVTLLPPLIGFLSIQGSLAARSIKFVGLALIILLSNPPSTLIIMPLVHLVLLALAPRGERRRHLLSFLFFWALYLLYYAPTIWDYYQNLPISSRSLFRPGPAISAPFIDQWTEYMTGLCVITPALIVLALLSRRSLGHAAVGLGGILLLVVSIALFNSSLPTVARHVPALYKFHTFVYRFYYYVSLVVLLMGSAMIAAELEETSGKRYRRAFAVVVLSLLSGIAIRHFFPGHYHFSFFVKCSLLIGLFISLDALRFARRPVLLFLLVVAFVFPARYWFAQYFEQRHYGNLYIEQAKYDVGAAPYRTVTLMEDCEQIDLYSAQAALYGREILDGTSNFYARSFAERWWQFVNRGSEGCTKRFINWNTRVELTMENWDRKADEIVQWLRLNNVVFLRSASPVEHSRLQPAEEKEFSYAGNPRTRYLYRLEEPFSRVFAFPVRLWLSAAQEREVAERQLLEKLANGEVRQLRLDSYDPGKLTFQETFTEEELILSSTNYHPGWTVLIDGAHHPNRIKEGPFGMIAVRPLEGHHGYSLVFRDQSAIAVIAFALLSLVLLAFGTMMRPFPVHQIA